MINNILLLIINQPFKNRHKNKGPKYTSILVELLYILKNYVDKLVVFLFSILKEGLKKNGKLSTLLDKGGVGVTECG